MAWGEDLLGEKNTLKKGALSKKAARFLRKRRLMEYVRAERPRSLPGGGRPGRAAKAVGGNR